MPFQKGHKVEPTWHRPVGSHNGLSLLKAAGTMTRERRGHS